MVADIDQLTRRGKPPQRGSAGGALVEHARRDERDEHADEKS
jgi:hypothetical protein